MRKLGQVRQSFRNQTNNIMSNQSYSLFEAFERLVASTRKGLEKLGGARPDAILSVIPQIVSLAKKKCKYPQHLEDYFQAGLLGAGKAFDRFDPDRGARYSTLAHYNIVHEMNDLTRDLILVPMSVHDMERRSTLTRLANHFWKVYDRMPSVDELTKMAIEQGGKGCQKLTIGKVQRLLKYQTTPVYMDAPAPGDDPSITMGDVLAYVYFDLPYTAVAA